MKLRKIIGTTLFYLLVAFIVVYTVFHFYWAIVSSLKEGSALYQVEFFPKDPKWGNYTSIFREQPFGRNILNSVIVAVTVVSISLVLSVTASYALARIEFRGRTPLLLPPGQGDVHLAHGLWELIRARQEGTALRAEPRRQPEAARASGQGQHPAGSGARECWSRAALR